MGAIGVVVGEGAVVAASALIIVGQGVYEMGAGAVEA